MNGQTSVAIGEGEGELMIPTSKLLILEDRTGAIPFSTILRDTSLVFEKATHNTFENLNSNSNYWLKFSVLNNSENLENWVLEQFNYRIDDLTLFFPNQLGKFDSLNLSDEIEFEKRGIKHKNLVFPIVIKPGQKKTFYFKLNSKGYTPFQLVIKNNNYFASYAVSEYFALGLFYGILLIFAVYNLILSIYFKDLSFFYYVLYVTFFGLFFMAMDGTGFQYIWFNFPVFNEVSYELLLLLTIISFLMYSRAILNVKENFPVLNIIIFAFIICRSLYFVVPVYFPEFSVPYIDLFPFALVLYISVSAYQNGNKPAIYFILSYSFLIAGFFIHLIRSLDIIQSSVVTFYSFYLAPLLDIIVLSLASAERVKNIRDKQIATEILASELEKRVADKTQALVLQNQIIEERIKAQDTFIFKVTHDLKGPLRSIVGLVKSARMDTKTDPNIYFDYILRSSERLDAVISDLLSITRATAKDLKFVPIDFKSMVADIKDSLKGSAEKANFEIITEFSQQKEFLSEATLLYSVFQNLIENAMNYRNIEAQPGSFLKISLTEMKNETWVYFKDNGIGIPAEFKNKIFDMFYRVDENHNHKSTGLGLYMVKIGLKRLESSVDVESVEGVGTTFILKLKNFVDMAEPSEKKAPVSME